MNKAPGTHASPPPDAPRSRAGVMHLVDSLDFGGAETVAVTLANGLGSERWRAFLCTTRSEGPGIGAVDPAVEHINLGRKSRLDVGAVRRLARFVRQNDIRLLHAHSTSLFTAVAVRALVPNVLVLWHAHFGKTPPPSYRDWLYAAALKGTSGVVAVSREVEDWVRNRLGATPQRLWWLPNIVPSCDGVKAASGLPGQPGFRVACVANIRPQKDHATLIEAFVRVVQDVPAAHLLLLGGLQDDSTVESLRGKIRESGLERNVTILGPRADVPSVLAACEVGVLSSRHEGLPIALLEYGMTRLAAVATDVGDCAKVLDYGQAGFVCRPGEPEELAASLTRLLRSPQLRRDLGERLYARTQRLHGPEAVISQWRKLYETLLDRSHQPPGMMAKESLAL